MKHAVLLLALSIAVPAAGQQLATKKALTLEVAKAMAKAAEDHAGANKWNVAISILDDGGHLIYFSRMDGVQIGSIEVSRRKAESALKFKRPTKAFSDRVKTEPQVVAIPGAFPLEGGLPIVHENAVIGAIGVSGVTSAQDAEIGQAALDALAKLVRK
jgi:uncharacterized protein GlcG (DUF336 family)